MSGMRLVPAIRTASLKNGEFAFTWEMAKQAAEELLVHIPDLRADEIARAYVDEQGVMQVAVHDREKIFK